MGFKKDENVVTLYSGWGILSARNWAITDWSNTPNYSKNIQDIYRMQNPGLFGTFAVLSPPIANFVRDEGFDTVEKLRGFVALPDPNAKPLIPSASGGSSSARAKTATANPGSDFNVVVTGATNNNYWMIGGMVPGQSVQIDAWR